MTQKVIASIYQKQITKTYNEQGGFICNFVLIYKDELGNDHKMFVYTINFEPKQVPNKNCYLVEVDIYAKQNVSYNNGKVYQALIKVMTIEPLMNDLEEKGAKEVIRRHYERKFP